MFQRKQSKTLLSRRSPRFPNLVRSIKIEPEGQHWYHGDLGRAADARADEASCRNLKIGASGAVENDTLQLSLALFISLCFATSHAMMSLFSAVMVEFSLISGACSSSIFATAGDISQSLPSNVWFQRFTFMLQTFALPVAVYFRPLCIAGALFWYVSRAVLSCLA